MNKELCWNAAYQWIEYGTEKQVTRLCTMAVKERAKNEVLLKQIEQ